MAGLVRSTRTILSLAPYLADIPRIKMPLLPSALPKAMVAVTIIPSFALLARKHFLDPQTQRLSLASGRSIRHPESHDEPD